MMRLRMGMGLALAAWAAGCSDPAGPIKTDDDEMMGSGGTSSSAGMGGSGQQVGGGVSFDDDVHPILVLHCGIAGCHDMPGFLPGHGAADANASFTAVQGMSGGQPVYRRILARTSGQGGFMPPDCTGPFGMGSCLSQAEWDTIKAWVDAGAMAR